ncbi:MAG: 16S rRNA (uracil(1498)-N(3))-methyltransferase [Desulfobacteraceae bacterium]|nr:MAG: 16S rRNA (uracil(1498)-N(3))-methyltransferase [Desulfobacteraceae bacterium]
MRLFFLPPEQTGEAEPVLGEKDARHIHTVLRLGPGEIITVFDGTGLQYEARIISVGRRQVRIALLRQLAAAAESPLQIVLAQGYLKDKKMDQLIPPLTELGVTRLVPFMARRSVPNPDAKRSLARRQRWQRISQEAVKQCRRNRPLSVDGVVSFEEALALSRTCDLKFFFWESGNGNALSDSLAQSRPGSVCVMIGPEGGFEAEEQYAAARAGFLTVRMGPRILRAETAAVVACTLVQYVFGDIGQNVLDNR